MFLIVGGTFLVIKNNSVQTNNSPTKKEDNFTPPSDSSQLQLPNNNPNSTGENKIEIKVVWGGASLYSGLSKDHWSFYDVDRLSDRRATDQEVYYYIHKDNPLLAEKKLNQKDLTFTLSFSPDQVVKKTARVKDIETGTILESNFNLIPNSPWQNHSNFHHAYWNNNKYVKFTNQQTRDDYWIFASLEPGNSEKFLVASGNAALEKMREEGRLVFGETFLLNHGIIDQFDEVKNHYYFNSSNQELYISKRTN